MIDRLEYLKDNFHLPQDHVNYLLHMRDNLKINPRVIYDIGSCTLHWYMIARQVWPQARIICFEGMESAESLYIKHNVEYHIDLLGYEGRLVDFYENCYDPAGNSYYRENKLVNPAAEHFYSDAHRTKKFTRSLDKIVRQRHFPLPDLIKMDVQGAELDVLTNAPDCLNYSQNVIAELQTVEYNLGAPLEKEIDNFLTNNNYFLAARRFSGTEIQGDNHYQKR